MPHEEFPGHVLRYIRAFLAKLDHDHAHDALPAPSPFADPQQRRAAEAADERQPLTLVAADDNALALGRAQGQGAGGAP